MTLDHGSTTINVINFVISLLSLLCVFLGVMVILGTFAEVLMDSYLPKKSDMTAEHKITESGTDVSKFVAETDEPKPEEILSHRIATPTVNSLGM